MQPLLATNLIYKNPDANFQARAAEARGWKFSAKGNL